MNNFPLPNNTQDSHRRHLGFIQNCMSHWRNFCLKLMVKLFVSSHNMRQFHNNFGWMVNELQSNFYQNVKYTFYMVMYILHVDIPFNFRCDFNHKIPFRNVFI